MRQGSRNMAAGLAAFIAVLGAGAFAANPIHVTYLWHMHQPNYYPYNDVNHIDSQGWFNFSVSGVHGQRTGPYTDWPKNAAENAHNRGLPHAAVQVSFSGSLMENLNGLWGTGWRDHWRWALNGMKTSHGNPRIDLIGFAYHHSLMPLTSRESMTMQIRLHKEAYYDNWDSNGHYSKGFFPPESSFAVHMVPALVSEGIEWALVDSGHIDRTLEDFPWSPASSIRPNRADQRNGIISDWNSSWTQLQNVWAPTPVAAPFSYQPHRIRYVDPNSDPANPTVYSMLAVPAARYEGNENGRGGYGAFKPENVWGSQVSKNNNPNRPMLIVCHSDGDNFGMLNADAYHGQHGMFLDMVQNNQDFEHTGVQDYLQNYPVPANSPYIHCEPGSWIGIDGGTPYFQKWVEDNARDGEHPDHWNWSVLIAAMNRVLHAENLEHYGSMNDVRWGIGNDTAKAWRNYLVAETSCYWYWDFDRANPWDGNVTRGANLAVTEANKVIARHAGVDHVGPTIFHPQRPIWNPGGKHWNEPEIQPSDFEIWTFVDDVSGVESVELKWRTADWNSYRNLNEYRHEMYAHTPGLNSAWNSVPMTGGWYPTVKGPHVPEPLARAQRYAATIAGQSDVLIGYYVEATDTKGNVSRSEIFHVWVGEGGETPESYVQFDPPAPDGCVPVTVKYNKTGSPLGGGPVHIHIGRNDWQDVILPNPVMADSGDHWSYTYATEEDTELINVVFHNGDGTWDNNGGRDWRVNVINCGGGIQPTNVAEVVFSPASPTGCDPVAISYTPNAGPLKNASPIYIQVGRNSWRDVISTAMTPVAGGKWEYTYDVLPGTYVIDVVFHNNAGVWDNNGNADWHLTVSGCSNTVPIEITSPASTVYVGQGVGHYSVGGVTDGSILGQIRWTNELTGGSGGIPAASLWSVANIPLGAGTNVITVTGSNTAHGGMTDRALDDAAHSAYSGGWAPDSNGGSGFGNWIINSSASNAGAFIASASELGNVSVGDEAFGLWANSGSLEEPGPDGFVEAIRPFSQPMAPGDRFSVSLDNNWILSPDQGPEGIKGIGMALQNDDMETIWQFWFNGGDTDYNMTGQSIEVPWTGDGMDVVFTLTDTETYSVKITPYGSGTRTYSGNIAQDVADKQITRFRAWNWRSGPGWEYNYYFNNLRIETPSSESGSTHSDSVIIIRTAGNWDTDTNGDGVVDGWYQLYGLDFTIPNLSSQLAPGGKHTYMQKYRLGLNPNNPDETFVIREVRILQTPDSFPTLDWTTVGGKSYEIESTDSMLEPFVSLTNVVENAPAGVYTNRIYVDERPLPASGSRVYRIKLHE